MKKIILSVLTIGLMSVGAFAQKQIINAGSLDVKQDVQVAEKTFKVNQVTKDAFYTPSIFGGCADINSPTAYVFSIQTDTFFVTGSNPYFGGAGQAYSFSSAVTVTGVAAVMANAYQGDAVAVDIDLLDNGLSTLATTQYNTADLPYGEWTTISKNFPQSVNVQNFILGVYYPEYTATSTDVLVATTTNGCSTDAIYINYQGTWTDAAELFNGLEVNCFIFPILQGGNGLTDVELNNLTYVYPNPANDEMIFASSYTINTIEIYNVLGQRIFADNVGSISTKVNVESFSAGNYLVKLYTEGGVATKKIVVK